MAKQRSSKFWFDNEKKVMKKLGLRPVPGSGSGELHKEDGENDYILCQLKSTEAASFKLNRLDIEKLLYHAELVNKIPIFVVQFMNGPMLIGTVPEELGNIAQYLNEDLFVRKQVEVFDVPKQKKRKVVRASCNATVESMREMAVEELEEKVNDEPDDFLNKAFQKRKQNKK